MPTIGVRPAALPRRRARIARLILLAGAAALAMALAQLVAAAPADAHDYLLATSPTDGVVLESQPAQVRLDFSGPVSLTSDPVQVLDRHGERVEDGPTTLDETGAAVTVGLRADLAIGTYVVTWRAVSDDAHPIRGSFLFSVGEAGARDPVVLPPTTEAGQSTIDVAVRAVWYAGVLLAAGGLLFLFAVRSGSRYRLGVRRMTRVAAFAGLAATVASVPLQAALSTGTWSTVLDLDAARDVLSTSFGTAAVTRAGGLALIVTGVLLSRPAVGSWLSGVGAAAAVYSVVQSGHAVTTSPRLLTAGVYLVHGAGAAVWFGGLAALAICLRRNGRADGSTAGLPADTGAAARMAVRYSGLAAAGVAAIGAAGLVLAYLQVRTLDGLGTRYGLTLLVKVSLVSAAGLIGWYNRTRLISVLRREPGRRQLSVLRRLVTIEVAIIAAVLVVTASLTALEPPRVQAALEPRPVTASLPIGDLIVQLTVSPARLGINTVTGAFTDVSGRPAHPGDEVVLEFSLPARDITRITRTPARTGIGRYRHQGPELSVPGRWRVEVQTRTSDVTLAAQQVEVEVP